MSEIITGDGETTGYFIVSQSEQAAQEESIFFDRWESYFLRYIAALGLPFDATDREIVPLMEADLKTRNTHIISDFQNR